MANRLTNLLTDPTWWFTAGFMAIVTSMIASFLNEGVRRVLAKLSVRGRQALQVYLAAQIRRAEWTSADPMRMMLVGIRIALTWLLYLDGLVTFVLAVMLYQHLPADAGWVRKASILLFMVASLIVALFTGWRASYRLQVYLRAYYLFYPELPKPKGWLDPPRTASPK